jgi:hypothetical protein
MSQIWSFNKCRERYWSLLSLKADTGKALAQRCWIAATATCILILTGISTASELAKEKGSMAHLHQAVFLREVYYNGSEERSSETQPNIKHQASSTGLHQLQGSVLAQGYYCRWEWASGCGCVPSKAALRLQWPTNAAPSRFACPKYRIRGIGRRDCDTDRTILSNSPTKPQPQQPQPSKTPSIPINSPSLTSASAIISIFNRA